MFDEIISQSCLFQVIENVLENESSKSFIIIQTIYYLYFLNVLSYGYKSTC